MPSPLRRFILYSAAATLLACGPRAPRSIALGSEPCAHCHMTITDPRFTAEAITATGRAVVFDDVGCLSSWMAGNSAPVASAWVTSFVDRRSWLDATTAVYLHSDSLRTPMASGLAALRPGREADSVRAATGGTLLSWSDVLALPRAHRASPAS